MTRRNVTGMTGLYLDKKTGVYGETEDLLFLEIPTTEFDFIVEMIDKYGESFATMLARVIESNRVDVKTL